MPETTLSLTGSVLLMPVCQYFIAHCPFLFASVQKALSKRAELELC